MALEARLDKIPNFVTAESPQGLRRAMLRNNIQKNMQFVYHSIQFVNNRWIAWYYAEAKASEVLSDNNSGEV